MEYSNVLDFFCNNNSGQASQVHVMITHSNKLFLIMLWVGRNVSTEKKQHKTFLLTDIGTRPSIWPQEWVTISNYNYNGYLAIKLVKKCSLTFFLDIEKN